MSNKLSRNLSKERYLAYLRLLPDLRKQKNRDYTMLVLTFFALSFFGIFAINPTFSTISKLRRELSDNKFAEAKLQEKIANMSTLLQEQTIITNDLPTIFTAVPDGPSAPKLLGQLQALSKKYGVVTTDIQAYEVPLTKKLQPKIDPSLTFSISVSGDITSLSQFLKALSQFDRLVTITDVSYNSDEGRTRLLSIKGKAFYIPKP